MATAQSRFRRPVVNSQLSRFDLLLAAIPLALTAGIASSFVVAIPFFVGVAMGATVAAALVGYGIYVVTRQPTMSTDSPASRKDHPAIE